MGAKRCRIEQKRRIFLVDDHPIMREGFSQLINHQLGLEVCGQAGAAGVALAQIGALRPELVVVDIALDGANGIELIKSIRAVHGDVLILVLSMHEESLYAERALRAGARGYIMKQAPVEQVIASIRQVLRGERYLSPRMQERLLGRLSGETHAENGRPNLTALSDRELEVFHFIGDGLGTREIATRLRLSIKTIETYRAHLRGKLKLRNGLELIRLAMQMSTRIRRPGVLGDVLPSKEPLSP